MAQGKPKISTTTLVIAAVILAVGALLVVKLRGSSNAGTNTGAQADGSSTTPGADDKVALAQCLTDKGVKFFGASWCPHCAQQKKSFGTAAMKKVTYIECAVVGDNSQQTQICKDNNIKGYPTWRFPDGSEKTGEQTLEDLASASGCSYGDVKAGTPAAPTDGGTSAGVQINVNVPVGPRAE